MAFASAVDHCWVSELELRALVIVLAAAKGHAHHLPRNPHERCLTFESETSPR